MSDKDRVVVNARVVSTRCPTVVSPTAVCPTTTCPTVFSSCPVTPVTATTAISPITPDLTTLLLALLLSGGCPGLAAPTPLPAVAGFPGISPFAGFGLGVNPAQNVFVNPIAQLSALSPFAALAALSPTAALTAVSPALQIFNPAVNPAAALLSFNPGAAPALAVTGGLPFFGFPFPGI